MRRNDALSLTPFGSFSLTSLSLLAFSRSRHCAHVSPPSMSSPRTVVFPSRKGSESARSILRGLPPTSTLLRFRTAERAVSWSMGQGSWDLVIRWEVEKDVHLRIRRNH